jgi:hypothetical protein
LNIIEAIDRYEDKARILYTPISENLNANNENNSINSRRLSFAKPKNNEIRNMSKNELDAARQELKIEHRSLIGMHFQSKPNIKFVSSEVIERIRLNLAADNLDPEPILLARSEILNHLHKSVLKRFLKSSHEKLLAQGIA